MVRGIPKLFTKSSDRSSLIADGRSINKTWEGDEGARQPIITRSYSSNQSYDTATATILSDDTYTRKSILRRKHRDENSNKNTIRSVSWSNTFDTYEEEGGGGSLGRHSPQTSGETFDDQDINLLLDFNLIYNGDTDIDMGDQSTFDTYETRQEDYNYSHTDVTSRSGSSNRREDATSDGVLLSQSDGSEEMEMQLISNAPSSDYNAQKKVPKQVRSKTPGLTPVPPPSGGAPRQVQRKQLPPSHKSPNPSHVSSPSLPPPPPPTVSTPRQVERKQLTSSTTRKPQQSATNTVSRMPPRQEPQVEFRNLACASNLSEATVEATKDKYGGLNTYNNNNDDDVSIGGSFMKDMKNKKDKSRGFNNDDNASIVSDGGSFMKDIMQNRGMNDDISIISDGGSFMKDMKKVLGGVDETQIMQKKQKKQSADAPPPPPPPPPDEQDQINEKDQGLQKPVQDAPKAATIATGATINPSNVFIPQLPTRVIEHQFLSQAPSTDTIDSQATIDSLLDSMPSYQRYDCVARAASDDTLESLTRKFSVSTMDEDEYRTHQKKIDTDVGHIGLILPFWDRLKNSLKKKGSSSLASSSVSETVSKSTGYDTELSKSCESNDGEHHVKIAASESSDRMVEEKIETVCSKPSQDETSVMTECTGGCGAARHPTKSVSFGDDVKKGVSNCSVDSQWKSVSFYDDEKKVDNTNSSNSDEEGNSDASTEVNSAKEDGRDINDDIPTGNVIPFQDLKKSKKSKRKKSKDKKQKSAKSNNKNDIVVVMDQNIIDILDCQSEKRQQSISDTFQPQQLPDGKLYDCDQSCNDSCVTTESILTELKVIEDTAKMMYQQLVFGDEKELPTSISAALFSPTDMELVLDAKCRDDDNEPGDNPIEQKKKKKGKIGKFFKTVVSKQKRRWSHFWYHLDN